MTADDRSPGAASDSSTLVMPTELKTSDPWDLLRSHADAAPVLQGYRNRNHRVDVPESLAEALRLQSGDPVKIRVPIPSGYPFDQAVWSNEAHVLEALQGHLTYIPRVLATKSDYSVQTFVDGDVLSQDQLRSETEPGPLLGGVAKFFAELAAIPPNAWPDSPEGWPASGESRDFLRAMVDYTDDAVRKPVWLRFGALLEELGFPEDAMILFRDAVPKLTSRPFVLLHADVHPGNLIKAEDDSLHVIDWELAMIGDPLHDLAIHLTRSRYTRQGRRRFIGLWIEEVGRVNAKAVQGARQDLRWYIDYQRLRSVYTDVVRTVEALVGAEMTPDALERAVREVRRLLGCVPAACERPTYGQVRGALLRWVNENHRP